MQNKVAEIRGDCEILTLPYPTINLWFSTQIRQ